MTIYTVDIIKDLMFERVAELSTLEEKMDALDRIVKANPELYERVKTELEGLMNTYGLEEVIAARPHVS